ncbi:hypothetical protein [Streptococcus hyointestinalis]|uniref:hypothetical protein n=1 Tax=Streptococcus hyointestinalis TaxID=1337 RepID=UPI0023F7EFCB|nr:hypothetical protein [Streptococcus hyointestinalis]
MFKLSLVFSNVIYPIILFGLASSMHIYKLRNRVWQTEYIDRTVGYMLTAVSWFLNLLFVYYIYLMIINFKWMYAFSDIALALSSLIFITGNNKDHFIMSRVDRWLDKKRVDRFRICPYCGSSRCFYRTLVNIENVCYYLLNQRNELIFLGFYHNRNHIAKPFVEEQSSFNTLIKHYFPLLASGYEDVVLYRGQYYPLEHDLYCSKCHQKVNSEPIERGMLTLAKLEATTIKSSK